MLDLVGFVAATFQRGLPYYAVPTTLLAMVDASIGGKNGVNVLDVKNLIGTIYHPEKIFIDVSFLETLPYFEMQNGVVEMIKHALLDGHESVAILEKDLERLLKKEKEVLIRAISKNVQFKKEVVEASAKTPRKRDLLNFGHTIGHALEALEGFTISHGQAVAMGILAECRLAYQLGLLSKENLERISTLHTIDQAVSFAFTAPSVGSVA